MPSITFTHQGSFKNVDRFLKKMKEGSIFKALDRYGKMGVDALSSATPVRTGLTAASWTYEIHQSGGNYRIDWINTNENKGVNIAVILQYGHGTGTGGYVAGRDYINPAMRPVFDKIADDAWKEVTSA